MKTVLIRESDRLSLQLLRVALDKSEWTILPLYKSSDPVTTIESLNPDIVFLDVDQEDEDGLLKSAGPIEATIIVVTEDLSDRRAMQLLSRGADMVFTKPLAPDLLEARLNAAVRHTARRGRNEKSYVLGELVIELQEPNVFIQGRLIRLSSTEYRLLRAFATNEGRILTHDQLLRIVWGPGYEQSKELLRTFISSLRRALRTEGLDEELIHTERQLGYWIPRSPEAPEPENTGKVLTYDRTGSPSHARDEARRLRQRLKAERQKLIVTTLRLQSTLTATLLIDPGRSRTGPGESSTGP